MKVYFNTDKKLKIVDCLELVPPEPMIQVLEAVESLQQGEAVLMIHHKEPFPLYQKLEEKNCSYELKTITEDSIQLLIWKTEDENR